MDDLHRAVGKIEGAVEAMQSDLGEIKKDVKALNKFRWRVAGGAAVISVLISALVEFLHITKGF